MFTLDNLDTETAQEKGAWLHLVNPANGELAYIDKEKTKPCRIKFKGWQSEAGKESALKGRNKMMREAVKQGKDKGQKVKEMTIEDLKENAATDAETLKALVIDWENICGSDGKPIEFSKEAFYNAAIRALDLRKQALEFIQDQTVFFEA
ncbi:conserved hypothetical protein [Vibrio phage 137E35-1]|nr:conserved hypothetical protein [Vibrio phage 137E35-1]CAH9015619.1 conserved hypothetical protein [Vibrio phage 230E39-1]